MSSVLNHGARSAVCFFVRHRQHRSLSKLHGHPWGSSEYQVWQDSRSGARGGEGTALAISSLPDRVCVAWVQRSGCRQPSGHADCRCIIASHRRPDQGGKLRSLGRQPHCDATTKFPEQLLPPEGVRTESAYHSRQSALRQRRTGPLGICGGQQSGPSTGQMASEQPQRAPPEDHSDKSDHKHPVQAVLVTPTNPTPHQPF